MTFLQGGVAVYVGVFLVVLTVLVFVHELGHYLIARGTGCGSRCSRSASARSCSAGGTAPARAGSSARSRSAATSRCSATATPARACRSPGSAQLTAGRARGLVPLQAAGPARRDRRRRADRQFRLRDRRAGAAVHDLRPAVHAGRGRAGSAGQRRRQPAAFGRRYHRQHRRQRRSSASRTCSRSSGSIPNVPMTMVVRRDGELVTLHVTPSLVEETDRFGNAIRSASSASRGSGVEYVKRDPVDRGRCARSARPGTCRPTTLQAMWQMVIGTRGTDELGGPLRIAQMSGEVAQGGIVPLLWFMAVLSINLGLINLFPVPVLDGGHLLFYAAEAIRGKPLGQRAQEYGFRIGLALVLTLMVFATWNDLVHLGIVEYCEALRDLSDVDPSSIGGWSAQVSGWGCLAAEPRDVSLAGGAAPLRSSLASAWLSSAARAGARHGRRRQRRRRSPQPARGGTIADIRIEGIQRIEPETVRSYLLLQPGDPWDAERVDRSLKALFATGLFADVKLDPRGQHAGRQGGREPDHQPHRLRGKLQARRQGPQRRDPAAPARRLYPHPGAERRQAHPRSLSPARPLRRDRRAQGHPAVGKPRRSRLRDQRRAVDRRAQHQLRRQPPVQRRHAARRRRDQGKPLVPLSVDLPTPTTPTA